jgi:hypothetical protein
MCDSHKEKSIDWAETATDLAERSHDRACTSAIAERTQGTKPQVRFRCCNPQQSRRDQPSGWAVPTRLMQATSRLTS